MTCEKIYASSYRHVFYSNGTMYALVNGFKYFKNLSASYLDNGRVCGKLYSILKFLIKPY
jgi:hypothetical protein